MSKPLAFIMTSELRHLDAEDIQAGVEHIDQLLAKFQAKRRELKAEQKRRGVA